MAYALEIVCASVFTVFCIVSAKIYSFLNLAYTYWDKKNVNGPKPKYLLGTWEGFAQKFLGKEDHANCLKYGKVYGSYDGLTPNLVVADPDVFKEVLVSSAESFQDVGAANSLWLKPGRGSQNIVSLFNRVAQMCTSVIFQLKIKALRVASENSVVLKNSLLSLSGGEKSEVQILTSSLLDPHKLEKLIPKLESSAENLIHNIAKEREEDGRLNLTSSVTEFINDAIALTVFGIELNTDIQLKDEFVKNSEQILTVKNPQSIWSILPFFYENYFKDAWIFPKRSLQYFVNLIMSRISESSIEAIVTEGKVSNLVELMVEAAEEEKKLVKKEKEEESEDLVLTDSAIISKCIASVLTLANATRTTVLLGIYALADNEEIQDKLFKEIEKNKPEKLSYEDIQNFNYLDKVIKEVLRLYPFNFRLERISTDKVKLGDIEIDKNVRVSIPLYALHRLEEFYPEPETFDPERFSQSASEKRSPFTYLPFGQAGLNGTDISHQLGILASKVIILRLVEKFQFSGAQQTGLQSLFQKGFTRVPKPEKIEIIATPRM